MTARVPSVLLLVSAAILGPASAVDAKAPDAGPSLSGGSALRPYVGVTSYLDVDPVQTALGGTKFVVGADYLFGGDFGFVWLAGFRVGAGAAAVTFQPLFELHYRWSQLYPLVPSIGGGVSMKASPGKDGFNLAFTGRFVAGFQYFVSRSVGLGLQFALPDLGARVAPKVAAVGNIEVLLGPELRF